ncbi:hypothetical protein HXXDennis_54 [Xanthomonas phage HXX_Dennis]|nr:hypothetical protein CPT_Suso_053 [Stenotrophomonas phage Suso]TXH02708.1 MAG: KTSC domain-containing protein [Nevskiaceae bacterium]UTQ79932.1 hypothetical protein HXXDennis_54 [Xanthomonas phage HXX_Dennis]
MPRKSTTPKPPAKPRKIVPTKHISEVPQIRLEPVVSSQVQAIGHDPATNTLAIRFPGWDDKPGSLYHYANFNADQFAEFCAAESVGSFFIKQIKANEALFPYTKIDETPQA